MYHLQLPTAFDNHSLMDEPMEESQVYNPNCDVRTVEFGGSLTAIYLFIHPAALKAEMFNFKWLLLS